MRWDQKEKKEEKQEKAVSVNSQGSIVYDCGQSRGGAKSKHEGVVLEGQ